MWFMSSKLIKHRPTYYICSMIKTILSPKCKEFRTCKTAINTIKMCNVLFDRQTNFITEVMLVFSFLKESFSGINLRWHQHHQVFFFLLQNVISLEARNWVGLKMVVQAMYIQANQSCSVWDWNRPNAKRKA